MTDEKKKEIFRGIKFFLFSVSAGAIQILTTNVILFYLVPSLVYSTRYLIGLVLSVIWNFTFNRKFTFKSANNVPKAMLLVLAYYLVFTPASTVLAAFLFNGNILEGLAFLPKYLLWPEILVQAIVMIINLVTEYLFDTFVVFKGSIDTNDIAKKEAKKEGK